MEVRIVGRVGCVGGRLALFWILRRVGYVRGEVGAMIAGGDRDVRKSWVCSTGGLDYVRGRLGHK